MTSSRENNAEIHDGGPELYEFWQGCTFEAFARAQGVRPAQRLGDFLGGWPEDQIQDGFEDAVERWRREDEAQPRDEA